MKIKVRALEDVNRRAGDVVFNVEKGQIVKLSNREAGIAIAGGDFELVDEAEVNSEKAQLQKKQKPELVEIAKSLGITEAETANKEPLIDLIIEARAKQENN